MPEIQGEFSKDNLKETGSRVRIVTGNDIRGGLEGPKYSGEAWVTSRGGRERKAGRYFTKTIIHGDIDIKKVMEKYHWLKRKRLPVLRTFRYNSETNTLLMTELSEGGTRILIDRHHPLTEFGIKPDQIQNWEELKDEVNRIAVEAYDNGKGVGLDDDNYLIALDKLEDGYRGELYLVDIGYGANFLSDLDPRERKSATLEANRSWGRIFINEIQGLSPVRGSEIK